MTAPERRWRKRYVLFGSGAVCGIAFEKYDSTTFVPAAAPTHVAQMPPVPLVVPDITNAGPAAAEPTVPAVAQSEVVGPPRRQRSRPQSGFSSTVFVLFHGVTKRMTVWSSFVPASTERVAML